MTEKTNLHEDAGFFYLSVRRWLENGAAELNSRKCVAYNFTLIPPARWFYWQRALPNLLKGKEMAVKLDFQNMPDKAENMTDAQLEAVAKKGLRAVK